MSGASVAYSLLFYSPRVSCRWPFVIHPMLTTLRVPMIEYASLAKVPDETAFSSPLLHGEPTFPLSLVLFFV